MRDNVINLDDTFRLNLDDLVEQITVLKGMTWSTAYSVVAVAPTMVHCAAAVVGPLKNVHMCPPREGKRPCPGCNGRDIRWLDGGTVWMQCKNCSCTYEAWKPHMPEKPYPSVSGE